MLAIQLFPGGERIEEHFIDITDKKSILTGSVGNVTLEKSHYCFSELIGVLQ